MNELISRVCVSSLNERQLMYEDAYRVTATSLGWEFVLWNWRGAVASTVNVG